MPNLRALQFPKVCRTASQGPQIELSSPLQFPRQYERNSGNILVLCVYAVRALMASTWPRRLPRGSAGNTKLSLLEKRTGTRASTHTEETRRYERHWIPVHLDIHVDDLEAALVRALDAGAKKEQVFENAKHGSAAFCSDPFGHGFCLVQRKQ